MCDQCDGSDPASKPSEEKSTKGVSRRLWLAMGGVFLAGAGLSLVPWRQARTGVKSAGAAETGGAAGKMPNPNAVAESEFAPATPTVAATLQSPEIQSAAATETKPAETPEASAPPPATGPAPDLGAAVFPDAFGRAIALPTDAPVIIVPRADWTTARPNLAQIVLMNGISRITVHHTAGAIQTDAWKPTAADLESIREFHAGSRSTDRGWADIAYHFAVDRAGRVWQARPLAYQGAHAKGNNEHNLGIVLLGNFEVQSPSAAQLTALAAFVGFVRKLYTIPLAQVFTHGELGDTSCPGKTLQEYMDRSRTSWGMAEGAAWKLPVMPRVGAEAGRGAAVRGGRSGA